MLAKGIFFIGVQAAAALFFVGDANAACLVLRGGATLEVKTVPERRGALMVFDDRNDRLTSLRTSEVDLIATDEANRRGVCGESAPGRAITPSPRASPWRETARPVAIEAPTELGVHSPNASEILAAIPAAGPPRGASIDCRVVECGKEPPEPAAPARGAAPVAPPAVEEAAATSVPRTSSPSRKLFGEGFNWTEPAEPSPTPPVTRKKRPHHGRG